MLASKPRSTQQAATEDPATANSVAGPQARTQPAGQTAASKPGPGGPAAAPSASADASAQQQHTVQVTVSGLDGLQQELPAVAGTVQQLNDT